METTLISIASIALIIIGTLTMAMSSLKAANSISDSWKQMEQQAGDRRRTEIAATLSGNYTGGDINLMVQNDGQTDLADFSSWDVIARYQAGDAYYIAYTATNPPGNDQWTAEGIYLSSNTTIAEVFDPNILNPDETAKVVINLNPEIGQGETGRITISTPNGVTSQCLVTRQ
jgi:hypothetical protein